MMFAFYAIPMAERIGYQFTFVFFACMGSILAFIPIVVLMWKGKEIRERWGKSVNINVFDSDLRAITSRSDEEEVGRDAKGAE